MDRLSWALRVLLVLLLLDKGGVTLLACSKISLAALVFGLNLWF